MAMLNLGSDAPDTGQYDPRRVCSRTHLPDVEAQMLTVRCKEDTRTCKTKDQATCSSVTHLTMDQDERADVLCMQNRSNADYTIICNL